MGTQLRADGGEECGTFNEVASYPKGVVIPQSKSSSAYVPVAWTTWRVRETYIFLSSNVFRLCCYFFKEVRLLDLAVILRLPLGTASFGMDSYLSTTIQCPRE